MNKDNQDAWLSISEASKYLRVSKDTLRRWGKKEILKPHRSPTNRRFYKRQDLERLFSKKGEIQEKKKEATPAQNNFLFLTLISLLAAFFITTAFFAWFFLSTR